MDVRYRTNRAITYSQQKKSIKSSKKFLQQEVELAETPLFFPKGFEHIFLVIYFMSLPYFAGLFFLFFYVANGDYKIFLSLDNTNSYILTWAIGYEILGIITLLVIVKNGISFSLQNRSTKKPFVIP